jgi:diguanylate cyclase (GGDEF)-like protein/putative nucleotidyltransferase with HDIG domain
VDWQDRPAKVKLYIAAVVAVALPIFAWAIHSLFRLAEVYSWQDWISLAGLTAVASVSSKWVVRIPRTNTWMAVADCLILSVTMIYGVAPGVLAIGLFHLVGYWFTTRKKRLVHRPEDLGWKTSQAVFNTASGGIFAFVYGWVYYAFLPPGTITAYQIILPVVLLAGTYFLVNSASMHAMIAVTGRGGFWAMWRENLPLVPLYFLASASGAAVIFFFHRVAGPWAFLLGLPILMVVYYAHHFYNERFEDLSQLYFQTAEAFALSIDALELHTDYKHHTSTHIHRTRLLTLALARALGVDDKTYEGLWFASVLHDVGKISIPSYILHKPTRLTEREFQKMSTHPAVGAQILSSINFPVPVIPFVKHHHENWDGSGYPDGLKGEEIPLGSRIMSVADCYEALTARRVYRRSLDRETAISIMKREAHRFDPRVFNKFLEMVDDLDQELRKLAVREMAAPKEYRDEKRMPDIVGVPQAPAFSDSISEPQREVFTLFEILQTIGNSLSRPDTLTIIAAKIEKIIPFTTLVIYLVDDSRGLLTPAHVTGQNHDAFKELSIEFGTRLAGWVAANNRMLYNVHPGPDVMLLPEQFRTHYHNSILAPLVHEDRPLGTIGLYWSGSERYSHDHVRLMEIIANRSSIALYNAIRFEETQEDAFTDRLTGLANSRFLYIFFEQTLSEAKRYDEPLTVIEMDLDDFKSVNDRFGHHAGDRFLKEVGRILKAQMRDSDVLVRYAGDEFIAVLPKTTMEQATQFSHRLQEVVEAADIDVGIGKMLSVGISLGLAAFPADGSDLESLLMAADRNMYDQKSRRKIRRRRPDEAERTAHQPSLFAAEEKSGRRVG